MKGSRFAEIMAELRKGVDGSNLIDRVQSHRSGEDGDEEDRKPVKSSKGKEVKTKSPKK